ncbi:TPA: hypothetical protein ACGO2T_002034 [Streptococcus suis]
MGHQIGRKIGDMLEIITMGMVYRTPNLLKSLDIEGKLEGYTSAAHKVEFGFFSNLEDKTGLFGAIECKCVGVEETKLSKDNTRTLKIGEKFDIPLNGQWTDSKLNISIKLTKIENDSITLKVSNDKDNSVKMLYLTDRHNFKIALDEDEKLFITSPDGDMLTEIPTIIRILRTIKVNKIEANSCTLALFSCLTGPQTIEKAKQASLVAMDLRKKIDGFWGKEDVNACDKKMNFVHVLCEFSHWEEKSRNVIRTCIDHNIIIPDAVLIYAFKLFEENFGINNMLDNISKKKFVDSQEVRDAVYRVLDHFENHVLYDIDIKEYVKFENSSNRLVVVKIDK